MRYTSVIEGGIASRSLGRQLLEHVRTRYDHKVRMHWSEAGGFFGCVFTYVIEGEDEDVREATRYLESVVRLNG